MITSLSIENFALIEKLSIQFSSGFSTITGETGAGKSILLEALGLVLGKRADLTSLKNKEEKCVIEAEFQLKNYHLQPLFAELDFDYEDQTIIRREILPSGKSRAFVNDTPVNLQELQNLSSALVDIHSQNQTQELSDDAFQFRIVDAVAGNSTVIELYSVELKKHKKISTTLEGLKNQLKEALKEQDYHSFLWEELKAAKLDGLDQEALEQSYQALNNVEFIKENLQKISIISEDEQFGVLTNLKEIKNSVQKLSSFSKQYESWLERINSLLIEWDDLNQEIGNHTETLLSDPNRLAQINEQLQTLYLLQKKHQVTSVDELISIQKELEGKVISVTTLEEAISALEKQKVETNRLLLELSDKLHKSRSNAIPELSSKIVTILAQLGMSNAQIKIELKKTDSFFENGSDAIQFLFSANKGADFGLLKKVASGGELSRIMLAVKSILAQFSNLPTIIFDEIDTGVSGEIADKMGEIMKKMSKSMQVFSITHLPQIAAKGEEHFKVFKRENEQQTSTQIVKLKSDERINEIAQMLSGSIVTESAFNNAKELLK